MANLQCKRGTLVRFRSGFAIDSRVMIAVLLVLLRDVLDALAFDKWLNMMEVANKELKFRRGEIQVEITGYGFTVSITRGTVRLEHAVRDEVEVKVVREVLRSEYGDEFHVNVRKSDEYVVVTIPMYVLEKYNDIKEQVIQVLCRKLQRINDERKRREIVQALRRLALTMRTAIMNCCIE